MPQIRVKSGPQKGKIIPVVGNQPIVIGREPSCSLQIVDRGVSREHAQIFRVGEMVFIRDLGSRNGCFVNEERVKEELLREGDTVRVGNTQLLFESRRTSQEQGGEIQYEDGQEFRTSLELKIDDLYVAEGTSPSGHREGELFKAICQATQIMQSESDEQKLFGRLLELIQEHCPADNIFLFLRDETTGQITPRSVRPKNTDSGVPISRSILRRVITESRAILTADAMQDDRFKADDSIVMNKIRSVLCVPIQGRGAPIGAMYSVNSRLNETFDQADLQLVTAMGTQLGLSLENMYQVRGRRRMFLRMIGRILSSLEGYNSRERGHAERVMVFAAAIAREMNFSEKDLLSTVLAALLHDIGKLPTVAVLAPDPADPAAHILAGIEFVRDIPGVEEALPAMRSHHERFDGSGFPDKLKSLDIPIGARVVALASDLDRIVFPAGNQAHASEPDASLVRNAFTEITSAAGRLYDPEVVRALLVAHRHGALRSMNVMERMASDSSAGAPAVATQADTTTSAPAVRGASAKLAQSAASGDTSIQKPPQA